MCSAGGRGDTQVASAAPDRESIDLIGSTMDRCSTVPTVEPASIGVIRKKLRGDTTVTVRIHVHTGPHKA